MSENLSLSDGYIVAELTPQPEAIYATGLPDLPILVFPFQMLLRCPKGKGRVLDFRDLSCRLSPFDKCYIAESRSTALNIMINAEQSIPNHLVHFEIPLDRTRLASVNRWRKGKDVHFRLDVKMCVDDLVQIGITEEFPKKPILALSCHHILRAQINAVISRAVWVEKILSLVEFAKIHIIELPAIPIENCAPLKSSFDALLQAQKLESDGYYHEAIGKCRIALEPFFEMVEKTNDKGEKQKIPVLKTSWQTRIGKATYDWLNASLAALKFPANQAVHHSAVVFGQAEAQMLLTVTTAMVAYAIKTQESISEPPPAAQ